MNGPVFALALAAAAESAGATRAVFSVFEGSRLNVYAKRAGDPAAAETLLVSEEANPRERPGHVLRLRASPRGDRLAYLFRDAAGVERLFLIDPALGRRDEIRPKDDALKPTVREFAWSPDGRLLLFSTAITWPNEDEQGGMPLSSPGDEWHLLDLASGEVTLLLTPAADAHQFGGWKGREIVFFKNELLGLARTALVVDVRTRRIRKRPWPFPRRVHAQPVLTSPGGGRAVVGFDGGWENECPIVEVGRGWELGRTIVANREHRCESIGWNTDDELFYGKGTGPKGTLDTRETTASGYYALLSVYRYDFRARTEHAVLKSDGSEVYRLLGLLPGRFLVVSTETARPARRFRLEVRRLDGSEPMPLRTSDNEMTFGGWLR